MSVIYRLSYRVLYMEVILNPCAIDVPITQDDVISHKTAFGRNREV